MKKTYTLFLVLFISASAFAVHVVTITQTNVLCNGMCDGTLAATVTGGIGPFSYSWTPLGGAAPSASGLCAGSYTVTVTDSSDLSTATAVATITEPPLLTATISGGGVTICSGACTTLTANVIGGTPGYTYAWTPGGTMLPTYSVCPITGATYTVVVTDMNGCTATSVTSISATVIPVTVNSPIICPGGTATLTALGASAYSWSTGASANPLTVSPASTTSYTVIGTSSSCTASAVATVTVNPVLTVSLTPSDSVCYGLSVPLNAIPLGGSGGYTYIWTLGATLSSATIANPLASPPSSCTYTVTVTDVNGCIANSITTIWVDPQLTLVSSSLNSTCSGMCNGQGVVIPSGGSPSYTYLWSLGGSGSSTSGLCVGTYSITVTDAWGCTLTDSIIVSSPPPIIIAPISTNATGCTICDGTVSSSPIGGTAAYVYMWSPMGVTTPTVIGLCAGTYTVTVTDANGCTVTDSTTIYNANDAIANFTMVPDSTNAYNFFAFNSSTGTGNSYSWNFGDLTASSAPSPSHIFAALGTYTVCLTASNFLCGADTLCKPTNVTGVLAPCLALFNIADDTLNPDPNAHYVYNLSYGATLSYLWDFGDGTTSTSMTPSHVYAGTGPYLLCLSVNNGAGCTDMFCDSLISADSLNRSSGTMQLVVYDLPTFYTATTGISNQANLNFISVSPNPFNDVTVFEIKSNKTEIYSFELTDVLGKKVKSKIGITEKQFEISREGLQNGIYFYKVYASESVVGIGKVVIK